ncbi:unnamed protein product [Scytosiphon promiscuus]
MLGPDETDQLAAATAKVKARTEAGGESEGAGGRQEESKRKASAVARDDDGENGSGKRTAGVGGGGVGDGGAAEGAVSRRLRSGGGQDKSKESDKESKRAGGVEITQACQEPAKEQELSTSPPEEAQEKITLEEGTAQSEAERVDVGAWAAAAPASRSPVVMVRHVDALEVSPEAICHLFGLYGDVMKVKLVASRGMALVQMRYPVQAVNAQRLLDQTPLSGMTLEVKASSQWTINDPTATDFSGVQGLHRQVVEMPKSDAIISYQTCPSPEDKRYRDSMSPPCPTLVVDNVPPDVSAEAITSIFAKHGAVSSVDLDTHAEAPLDAASSLPSTSGSNLEPTSVQALVHMEADGKVRATEAAVHALIMAHNLTLADRRLRVSFLSGERHVEK